VHARQYIDQLFEDADYYAAEAFHDAYGNQVIEIADEFKRTGGQGLITWKRIPAARLKKVWLDFGRNGFIRDERGMEEIAGRMMELIVRLSVTNDLSSHSDRSPEDVLSDYDYQFTPEQIEALQETLVDEQGHWLVSDYGLKPLQSVYSQIFKAHTAEEKLYAVDRGLNIVHQRSDLAALFVEGGTKTLTDVANQGGYQTPESPTGAQGGARNRELADQ
jgi:hypothetical protein